MKPTLIDRDKFNSANKTQVAKATVKVFDAIQHLKKEIQLHAMAAAFVLLASALNFNPQEAFTATKNLMVDKTTSSGLDIRFDAMRFHAAEDLTHEASDAGLVDAT